VIIAGHQRVVVLMELGVAKFIDVRVPNRELTGVRIQRVQYSFECFHWRLDILNDVFGDIDLLSLG
jgi:hypothetical protein